MIASRGSQSDLTSALGDPGQEPPKIVVPPPGPLSLALSARLAKVESPAFGARRAARAEESGEGQGPIVYASARGSNVVDADGNRYVDLVAGFGALVLGHVPRRVARAVQAQSEKLWLALGDVYASDVKVELCERLAALLPEPDARVMLGSSGSDAVTAALKTAVLATGKSGVIAFEGGYHGLSYAPLAACGLHDGFRGPFAGQLGSHVTFLPYPGTEARLEAVMSQVRATLETGRFGAVLVEPILGRGGCVVPPASFLPALREACTAAGALLVVDEVWTGLGRSGALLSSLAFGVLPDLICLGKGLGAGLPISACIGRARAMQAWGEHGGATLHTATHFGAPVVCAAALATLDALATDGLVDRARDVGEHWVQVLKERTRERGVVAVRGRGLMVGVEVQGGAARALALTRKLLGHGYLVLTGGRRGDVLTLTPPLTIDEPLLGGFSSALAEALVEVGAA